MSWVDFGGDCLRMLEEWQLMSQKRAKSSFKFLGGLTSWAPNLLLDGIPDKNREWGTSRNSQKLPSKPNPYGFGPHKHARLQRFFSNSSSCLLQALVEVGGPSFLGGPWDWVCPEVGHVQVNHPHPSGCGPHLWQHISAAVMHQGADWWFPARVPWKHQTGGKGALAALQLQGTSSACLGFQTFPSTGCLPPSLPPSPGDPKHLHQGISRGWPKPP